MRTKAWTNFRSEKLEVCYVLSYDCDKRFKIYIDGMVLEVKACYVYAKPNRTFFHRHDFCKHKPRCVPYGFNQYPKWLRRIQPEWKLTR